MKATRLRKRGTAALLAAGLAVFALDGARAETSIVVDVATGAVLSQKDATKRWYPASTTKLMTAYVALKALREHRVGLDAPVVMTRYAASQAPSKMGFEPGSVMRLDTALRMMLVKSANDVAVAIGQAIGAELAKGPPTPAGPIAAGPIATDMSSARGPLSDDVPEGGALAAFVEAMNHDAAALGMADTRFVNPNGLPGEGQHSSAKDLAILGAALHREFPDFSGYFATEAISTGNGVMRNGNSLLGRFEGADGMKTGYICASGFNLVSSATRNGRTLVAVVLGSDGSKARDRRAAELLESGFKATPGSGSMTLTDMPAAGGETADISERMCSAAGRTARAKAAKSEETTAAAEDRPASTPATAPAATPKPTPTAPAMASATAPVTGASADLARTKRPPTIVEVRLGGAAGNARVPAGITLIAAYGIPLPRFRPAQPNDAADIAASERRDSDGVQTMAASVPETDLGVTRRGIPVPTPRVTN